MGKMKRRMAILTILLFSIFTVLTSVTANAATSSGKEKNEKSELQQMNTKLAVDIPSDEGENILGNMWIQTTYDDFSKGTNEGTLVTNNGDGEVQLNELEGVYPFSGIYTSETVKTAPFEYLVLSWNADTPKGTSIKIEGQARILGQWSNWLSWGTWSSTWERCSASGTEASDILAYVDTDTFTVRGKKGETADAFRYRITLLTKNPNVTPSLRLVAATLNNTLKKQTIEKVYNDGITEEQLINLDTTLDVPVYSQYKRDPLFANSICSPTSMSMLLKFKGIEIMPEQAAMGVYDSIYDGYGNWPFNTAYAGAYGFTSYVEYMSCVNDLKREIIKGNPIAVSVKYRNDKKAPAKLPVVNGAPISYTYGHLIVVCGFTIDGNGNEYVVVNDPAAADDSGVRLKYLAGEFDEAWAASGRIAYIVHDKVSGDGTSEPVIQEAVFTPTVNTKTVDEKVYREYRLECNGETVNLNSAVDPNNLNYERDISIMYSKDGGAYEYVTPTEDTNLWLDISKEPGTYNFLIFRKTGDSYSAVLELQLN